VSLNFRYALSKTAFVTEDAEVVYAVNNTKDLRATSSTALNVQLTDGLALQVAYKVRYIGSPAAGKRTTDTELSTGLAWTW
jgi:putative salt-induced outer membrane protein YdiY